MIKFKNVNFTYKSGEREVGLKNINLTINKGQTILLCGESGCGKTTLTRLINGLIPHYYEGNLSGEVLIDDLKVNTLPLYDIAKKVGSVFQNPRSQFFNLDTTSELAFGCENQGLQEDEIENRIQNIVYSMKLDYLMDRSLFELSGGEKQKIACASVSVCDPDIYVLDEPSSNLDTKGIIELKNMLTHWKSQGKTIIIAEHRLYFLRDLVDEVLYMKEGGISEVYTAEQFRQMSNYSLAKKGLRPIDMQALTYSNRHESDKKESILLKDFYFSYNKNSNVLDIDSLSLPKNSIIALTGHNGAGKSTLARCLCGLEKGFKGKLEINGKVLKNQHRLSNCYMVMQDVNHQLFTESVLDEVLLSMENPDEKKAEEILMSLDLLPLKDLHPMSLSGGQKQRVAIASAIASKRSIILFDEPTSGLDLQHMQEVSQTLLKLKKLEKTLFVISHDLELILSCCDYVLQLSGSKITDHYALNHNNTDKLFTWFYGNETSEKFTSKWVQSDLSGVANIKCN